MNAIGPALADAPLFDSRAFRLSAKQAALLDRVRTLAATRFAPRAAAVGSRR